MPTSLHELLDDLRAGALDERDKGDRFERLIQAFLRADPEWAQRFDNVWLWQDWPGRQGRPDTGIDIVASNRDDDRFTAIQCKFYAAGRTVAKSDIDSFVTASANPETFSRRYVFDTSAGWSGNAEHALEGVAQRIDVAYLQDAAIDWDQFSWTTPSVVVPTGKKTPLPHQREAIADVKIGLDLYDRGKLIMACGTGKTFTSLRIAEDLVGAGGRVLFLVPSIQLLSQTLREWMANANVALRPFAVCSDVRVGRGQGDDADLSTVDLTEPATTNAATLIARMSTGSHAAEQMTVVFSTYQSIDVITAAQHGGLEPFDLVICDEAHRTSGVTAAGAGQSAFVRVHDATALRAAKRLYMTATPRVFADDARRQASDADAVLYDMGDEVVYGPEIHRLGFADAVEGNLLTDYKVLVLAVDEKYVADNFQQVMADSGELALDETAKLIGCWNGLAKHFGPAEGAGTPQGSDGSAATSTSSDSGKDSDDASADDSADRRVGDTPMRTAVAFAQNIKASQAAADAFPAVIDQALADLPDGHARLRVQAQHVDGTMRISERNAHLDWLKEDAGQDVCRILTNARCLSEGVDVPALDAVIFLTPRSSQVDVVQSVGRVMRKAPGKELGYIILPVVVPAGTTPEQALADNERFKVVWQVLQALRSHDDRFHVLVNQIELNKNRPDRLQIIPVTGPTDSDQDGSSSPMSASTSGAAEQQLLMAFPGEAFRDAMYARIVKKVGERRYWETWARDVADIAERHTVRITSLLEDPDLPVQAQFESFLAGLRGNLNNSISRADAVDMLAQHLITRPVFEALFEGYSFGEHNPVSQVMQSMLDALDQYGLNAENETLEKFYASVRIRAAGVDSAEGKQRIISDLYEKFFKAAFPKTAEAFGIVYTPIQIVDFILRSVEHLLQAEFGRSLSDEDVHVLDPFTGTGTFVVRLLQLGLISPHDLARKYASELHANEILLLAYYIAAINIEATYHGILAESDPEAGYEPFGGVVLADTFQMSEEGDVLDTSVFSANNKRASRQLEQRIDVIVSNPPYSVGQTSTDDDNANMRYPTLDRQIERTYAARSTGVNKNSLYDSYIRAIRWASTRIGEAGVVGFVTNGGFLDSNVADGLRKTLSQEFAKIYVLNLRGNQRTAGEESRREGGKIFGAGSRNTVAVTLLIRTPGYEGSAALHYYDIGDYLSREQKLEIVGDLHLSQMDWSRITPNDAGDWLNQRGEHFATFTPLGDRNSHKRLFNDYSAGVKTERDAWVYASSSEIVRANASRMIEHYNAQVVRARALVARGGRASMREIRAEDVDHDPTLIGWNASALADIRRDRAYQFSAKEVREASYRPFNKQRIYFDSALNARQYRMRSIFPTAAHENVGIVLTGPSSHYAFSVLATDRLPDLHMLDTGQYFPRWWWQPIESIEGDQETLPLSSSRDAHPDVVAGYRRIDNISAETVAAYCAKYGEGITADDIFAYVYGLLHCPTYRETFAGDLKRLLPRIPMVETLEVFQAFANAGHQLLRLHVGYEHVEPYPLTVLGDAPLGLGNQEQYEWFSVSKMRFGGKGRERDKTTVIFNRHITVTGIPLEAHDHLLGSRSGVDWVLERYQVRTDKSSGITNDPNAWSREAGNPRYILDLLMRVIRVGVETTRITAELPELQIEG